jgi:hypothetical protein
MQQECWTDWSYDSLSTEPDPRVVDAAHSLLAYFNIQTDSVSVPPDHMNKTARFLTLLLDPRLTFLTTGPVACVVYTGPDDPCVPGVRCKERAKGRGIAVAVHALDNPCTFLPCR